MTFNLDFLQVQRDFEYEIIKRLLPKNSKLLEIGAGPGYQAKRFSDDGFVVSAIDLVSSNYYANRVYEVLDYDGINIPFENALFDVVYSSSVLEHVLELDRLQLEISRVLKDGGIALHVLPSGAWRFWTLVSGYIEGVIEVVKIFKDILKALLLEKRLSVEVFSARWRIIVNDFLLPKRHGEYGNVITELWTFSALYWKRKFAAQGFNVSLCQPTGLFYTGNMLLGDRLPISWRIRLSSILGSACVIYVLKKSAV